MSQQTLKTRIILRNDSAQNWTEQNPTLLKGELGLELGEDGSVKWKCGDGVKTWTQLPYGSGAAEIKVDNKSIKLTDGTLALFGFGEQYKDNDGQPQDFEAGLQLVTENDDLGGFKLKWIKPDGSTVEGLNTRMELAEQAIKNLENEITALPTFDFKVVTELPSSDQSETTIYLKTSESGACEQYIWAEGDWKKIGVLNLDLTDYAKTADVESKISTAKTEVISAVKDLYVGGDGITISAGSEEQEGKQVVSIAKNAIKSDMIEKLDVAKLFVADGDTFILDGGNASLAAE